MPPKGPPSIRALLLGGLLPVIAFSLVEEYYGTWWGLIVGMAFGIGEIVYERVTNGRVDTITWIGNGLLLLMGGVSLLTTEGIWFKLQPAILEAGMGVLLLGSALSGKPLLVLMAEKQGTLGRLPPEAAERMRASMGGLTARLGLFFLAHAALATWAAFHWSTRAWILLKGVGFTGSMILYMLVEALLLRRRLARK